MILYFDNIHDGWRKTRSSPIQACSGDTAYCSPRKEKQPILPSDIVHYWADVTTDAPFSPLDDRRVQKEENHPGKCCGVRQVQEQTALGHS